MSSDLSKFCREKGYIYEDAKDDLTIQVRPEDIKGAKRGDPCACAIARAGQRQLFCEKVSIYRTTAAVQYAPIGRRPGRVLRYLLAHAARQEVKVFDKPGGRFRPMVIVLDAPKGSGTLDEVMKRSRKRPGRHQPGDGKIKRKVLGETSRVRINTMRLHIERELKGKVSS